jgi:hypothetical protein
MKKILLGIVLVAVLAFSTPQISLTNPGGEFRVNNTPVEIANPGGEFRVN